MQYSMYALDAENSTLRLLTMPWQRMFGLAASSLAHRVELELALGERLVAPLSLGSGLDVARRLSIYRGLLSQPNL